MQSRDDFLAWEGASRDTIDFKMIYVDLAGDLIAGLVLSQIVYWNLPTKDGRPTKLQVKHEGELWLARRRYDWFDEIRISPKQADRALGILEEKGFIEKRAFKFDGEPTTHVRILWDGFLAAMGAATKANRTNPYLPEGKLVIDQKGITESTFGEIPVTETFAETTAEINTCDFDKSRECPPLSPIGDSLDAETREPAYREEEQGEGETDTSIPTGKSRLAQIVAGYPEDIRADLAEICEKCGFAPPPKGQRDWKYWISAVREIQHQGMDAFREFWLDYLYEVRTLGKAPFKIKDPGSFVNRVSGKASEMRGGVLSRRDVAEGKAADLLPDRRAD